MRIGDLFLRVLADDKGFAADLEKKAGKAGAQAGKTISTSMGGEIKKGLAQGLGLGAGLGAVNLMAAGVGALTDAVGTSIQAASNLNEAVSKSEAVFKSSAGEIDDWADGAASAFGQSKRSALEAAGTFGNLIQAFGIGEGKAADMSKTLVELASDLASFNNTSVDEAIQALRSGLSGETEPLKRYGVALNDVRLKEEALRLGLIKTTKGVLPITIKTQAAYSLILKDTALAQGDFARTSEGMANQMKTTAAMAEDTAAKFGEVLLPIVVEFQRTVINALDRTSIAFADLEAAAARGSQGAGSDLRHLELIAEELGVSVETAFGLVADAGTRDMDTLRLAMAGAGGEMRDARDVIGAAGSKIETAFDGIGDEAKTTAVRVDEATGKMITSVADLRDATISAARDIVDRAYQIISDKAELTAVNVEKAELAKVIATDNATREQKARYRELTEAQAGLILDLAENGQENTKVVQAAVAQLREQLKTAVGQERKAILATIGALEDLETQYRNTARASRKVNWPSGPGGNVGGKVVGDPRRHSGGQVQADRPYVVGRTGAEELFIPGVSGRIAAIPEIRAAIDGGGAVGGASTTVNLTMPVERAPDPFETARQLRRLADFGVLRPSDG